MFFSRRARFPTVAVVVLVLSTPSLVHQEATKTHTGTTTTTTRRGTTTRSKKRRRKRKRKQR
jgi:hypothetical protein